MKRIVIGSAALALALSACGGGGGGSKEPAEPAGPLDAKGVTQAIDEQCAANDVEYQHFGVFDGYGWFSIVDSTNGIISIREETLAVFEEIEAEDPAVQKNLDELVAAVKDGIAKDEAVVAAATKQDDAALGPAYDAQAASAEARDKIYADLGSADACTGAVAEGEGASGTEPPADVEAVAVPGSVDDAATAFQQAIVGGDAADIGALLHSDFGDALSDYTKGYLTDLLTDAELSGSETYGPVGAVWFTNESGYRGLLVFIADGDSAAPTWKFASAVDHYASPLNPAPDGNDADANMKQWFDAAVAGDSAAFNETLYGFAQKFSSFDVKADDFTGLGDATDGLRADLISDVRSEKVEPTLLGRNVAYDFWFVPGTADHDWVLVQVHKPGRTTEYEFTGYWPIPKP